MAGPPRLLCPLTSSQHTTLPRSAISGVETKLQARIKEEESQQMMTTRRLLSEHHKVLEAMPSVLSALKLAVTFGASTAMCENSFAVLKNVFTDNRRAMNHTRKSQLVQLAIERNLTKKMRNEWKDLVLRKFNSSTRRLQLF
ncbi:hypothetical protein E1301_Tti023546 [Triplophysa tibetana]|uniref:HAT C-terminal dimerisation domain-containing protein n=1 Tax=Triplophysa tibetana TaxID=1572043 RepID=A0A5A9NBG9_9TELE|nr:hypothetical protein E1301_Tti023546 [Triplophysa tibetana]